MPSSVQMPEETKAPARSVVLLRPCLDQPCPNLVERGRCSDHQRVRNAERGTTTERGYGSDWQDLRAAYLAAHGVCQIRTHCIGAPATEVDHIVPIDERPDLRLECSNLQSACKSCNAAKAQKGVRGQKRPPAAAADLGLRARAFPQVLKFDGF